MTQPLEPARSGTTDRSKKADLLDTATAQLAERIIFVAGVCGVTTENIVEAIQRRLNGQR
jgi:hypothetical protein